MEDKLKTKFYLALFWNMTANCCAMYAAHHEWPLWVETAARLASIFFLGIALGIEVPELVKSARELKRKGGDLIDR